MIITRYQIKTPNKLKIVVVADLHGKPTKELLNSIKNEQPDLILIPGDLVTTRKQGDYSIEQLQKQEKAIAFLKKAITIAPIYYSKGNHEFFNDNKYFDNVISTGVILLNNEWKRFENIWIGGQSSSCANGIIEHIKKNDVPNIEWLNNTPEGFKILLCHHPEYYNYVHKYADLIISGHAHGGQWRFFNQGIFSPDQGLFPKYTHGKYDKMIVSAGLTNTTIIPRLFNPTELVVIEMI